MAAATSAAALEEPEPTQTSLFNPSVDSHTPASGKSQDISHVLASTFKDLYTRDIIGKDTLSKLIKTKSGRSSYHEKYVEELEQAHSEYNRCIKEADMLESHIIQARAQAAAKENQANERMKEDAGDIYDHPGHFTVKSAYSCCVDGDLLQTNDLISPQDYLPSQKPRVGRPAAAVKSDPAKPTVAYTMRVSKEPPSPERTPPTEMNESDLNLTFESSSDASKMKKTAKERSNQVKPGPRWKGEPSARDKAEAREELRKLHDRHNFLRNPHFLPPNTQYGGASLVQARTRAAKVQQRSSNDPVPVFQAKPAVVIFTDYSVGHVYEMTLELKNVTSASRQVRVIPPTTPYFSIGLGRFPGDGGVVAPGMSCKYSVRFAPDSLAEYEDFIVVETQAERLLVVPVAATRPPPILTLPRVLDCGFCLVGGVKFVEFLCENVGLSTGTFCIIPKSQWPASNLRSVARTYFCEQPPFAISPSLFVLQPGEATVVEVVFFPTTTERSCQVFTIVCDNCQVKDVSVEGEGQLVALKFVSVSGEEELPVIEDVRDLTAEHFVRFSPCNPNSAQQKKVVIRNNIHLELPFHWRILKPNLHPPRPGQTLGPSHIQFHVATDDAFHVSPPAGVLAPCQDHEFLFTFCPKELKDYHSVCHLVLRDVPQLPHEPSDTSSLRPVRSGSGVSDVIVMEIEVKGSTEPYHVLLEPYAVVIPGEIFISTTTRRRFKMWNHSKTFICFQWERMKSSSHIMEVEPSSGRIEENECFDFDLIVTGGKPEKVVANLLCHIEHRHEPVALSVEVCFKGPVVTVNVPNVDFGLMRFGERSQASLQLANTTQLEASWEIEVKDTQISVEPCCGVLPPLASYDVDLLFRPRVCQRFETELELKVENGRGCHVSVRADVQSPQVCLLRCHLLLPELYLGVPARGSVTLFNQTLLPTNFNWMAGLQGKQASLCSASFEPSSGNLGPNASVEITVNFTSHTDLELTDVVALCEVQGMNSPLVLSISASITKNLSVSYSLPSNSLTPDVETPETPLLDFGSDVVLKTLVSKRFLITNHTAITALFTVEAEYFTCHVPEEKKQPVKRFSYVKKPLHSVQAQKLEEKDHEEFVSGLLAHGKGAALFILPNAGTLGPFETQAVDVTAYTDMWGEYTDRLICKVGELEPAFVPVQMKVTGCPLYFQMTGPRSHDQNQGPIIQFGAHVSGGDTVSRSLRINNPSLFDIRLDWQTYNVDPNDRKLVDVMVTYGDTFPVKDADGNEVVAKVVSDGSVETAWGRAGTPDSEGTSASVRSRADEEEQETSEDDCLYLFPTEKKLFSVHIRPHVGNLSDYPYCITPQQLVIQAKSSSTIHVSFTPLTLSSSGCESRCVGVALGFMSLDSKMAACVPGKVVRAQGLDLEPVRMDLLAAVKPAELLVQTDEDDGTLEFHASAGDLLKPESEKELVTREFDVTQSLQLRNASEMVLQFRLRAQPPFTVLGPQTRAQTSSSSDSPSADGRRLVLQPQSTLQVKVAFHCSLSLLNHLDQTDEEVPPGVKLIQSANGQKKIQIQQNLLIHFSNNSLQTVPLRAFLDLPTLRVSTLSVDFGFCSVGQMETREVNLSAHGAQTYWKSGLESEGGDGDRHVFKVKPDVGFLKSKELHAAAGSQSLQISFTPSDEREFRSSLVIQSPLVKQPLVLQLRGTGSSDEGHTSK